VLPAIIAFHVNHLDVVRGSQLPGKAPRRLRQHFDEFGRDPRSRRSMHHEFTELLLTLVTGLLRSLAPRPPRPRPLLLPDLPACVT